MIDWKRRLRFLAIWIAVWVGLQALLHGVTLEWLAYFSSATAAGFGVIIGLDYLGARKAKRSRG
jgi:hypothetical protein